MYYLVRQEDEEMVVMVVMLLGTCGRLVTFPRWDLLLFMKDARFVGGILS